MSPETLNPTVEPAAGAATLVRRMDAQSGPAYWRSLNELAGGQDIDALVHREFPSQAEALLDPVSRRNFLRVMGASMMLAGLSSSCARQPAEQILPYVKPPEYTLPGRATFYASCLPMSSGHGFGVVATCFEGRPTHLSGLKEHTASQGAITPQVQASLLSLYDPDRLDAVLENGNISTYTRFSVELASTMQKVDESEGEGLRILTQSVTSPTLAWQIDKLRALYPKAQWHQYQPGSRDNVLKGAKLAFGQELDTRLNLKEARVIVALDSNFLTEGPAHVRYAADFAASRDVDAHSTRDAQGNITDRSTAWMSRLYAAESAPTLTGATADHRIVVRYPDVETLARLIARGTGVQNVDVAAGAESTLPSEFVQALVKDLTDNKGKAAVIVGDEQPAVVHALAHAINAAIGATTPDGENPAIVEYSDPVEAEPIDQIESLNTLVADMAAGKVSVLTIIGGNPAYTAPADIDFAGAMQKVAVRIHLTDAINETSWNCQWQVPMVHPLETWSDLRSYDGMTSLTQPMIAPLFGGRSAHELLAIMTGEDKATTHDVVKAFWTARRGTEGFDEFWRDALMRGYAMRELLPKDANKLKLKNDFGKHVPVAANELDIIFRLDPTVGDGRYANNAWLQELPKPLTNVTWDNAIHIHPRTAKKFGLEHEDVAEIEFEGRKVRGSVCYQFGQKPDTLIVHLGYGRSRCGHIGKGQGFNAYALQTSASPWFGTGAKLSKAGGTYNLARTEEHWNIEQSQLDQAGKAKDRHLIREASLAHWQEKPEFAQHESESPDDSKSLYYPEEKAYTSEEPEHSNHYAWGMTIDLNKCTGCAACVSACQSENNIPIVGKDQVNRGREMQWIRIDRYYKSDSEEGYYDSPDVVHQPVNCMQCENAPCEPVCPVGATQHSHEGLNDMVYNRCIGTRYCANNCPYKVRRFNFYHYQIREGQDAPSLKMMRNPNVTVRSRGVMEKCTYCVQRINLARIESKRRDIERERIGETALFIEDGIVVTACQQACPSHAITFGNIRDEKSAIYQAKKNPRNYALIGDIGTRPRTTYLAKLRNPSPALGGGAESHATSES